MYNLYTVVYDCDNGKNWKRVPAAELEELIENLIAFGMKELYIFSPSGSMITPELPLTKSYQVSVYTNQQAIPPLYITCEEAFVALGGCVSGQNNTTLPGQRIYTVKAFEDFPDALRRRLRALGWHRPGVTITLNGKEVGK